MYHLTLNDPKPPTQVPPGDLEDAVGDHDEAFEGDDSDEEADEDDD